MSAEFIAIIAAAVSLGGLVTAQLASLRSSLSAQIVNLDVRLRAVETELAYLRGLLQGHGLPAPPTPPADQQQGAA